MIGAIAACAGCATSGFHVEGVATSRGAAVAGATVWSECPQVIKATAPSELGVTDARGHFVIDEPAFGRWIHDGCDLIVSKPGYKTRRWPVSSVCGIWDVNHCTLVELSAELEPAD